MQIKDLLQSQPILLKLADEKMSAKLAYAMAKNIRLVNQELDDFEKARIKMLMDNWKINEETNQYVIPDEDKPRAQKMFDELTNAEVTFSPYTIKFSLLEPQQLSPSEMMVIDWMIEQEPVV